MIAALSVTILSLINTVSVFAYTCWPTTVKLPETVTSPDIVPPDELNFVLELSYEAWAKTLAELALLKAPCANVVPVFAWL